MFSYIELFNITAFYSKNSHILVYFSWNIVGKTWLKQALYLKGTIKINRQKNFVSLKMIIRL